MNKHCLKVP